MVVTLEIDNLQDLAIIEQLAKRLGWAFSTNESTEYLFGNEVNKKEKRISNKKCAFTFYRPLSIIVKNDL